MRTRSLLVALAVISALGLLLFLGWRTLVPRPEEPAGASSARPGDDAGPAPREAGPQRPSCQRLARY